MSLDLQYWEALSVIAIAAAMLGLAVRACRRRTRRQPARERTAWQPGEKAAFRWIRRLYPHLTAAEPDRARKEER